MTDQDGKRALPGWLPAAMDGVPFLGVLAGLIALVWFLAEGHFGPDARLTLLENRVIDLTKAIDDIGSEIDRMSETDTAIAVIGINYNNVAQRLGQVEGEIDSIHETNRDIQSQVRSIERDIARQPGSAR